MSRQSAGSMVGGAIGAVIGFYAGGNVALGYSIGASIGGYVTAPDVNTQGPRLSDNTTATSSYGAGIPRLYGSKILPEIRIWSGGLVEHEHDEDAGKGGPSVTNTTYTYTASWACLLCEGEINGIKRIWFDGKLVYDMRDTAGAEEIYASRDLSSSLTLYTGTDAQAVDPTIEAAEGVGNASAYRGWSYIVFNNLDVTQYGHIPFVEVEVFTIGSTVTTWKLAENTDPGVNFGQHPSTTSMALYDMSNGVAKVYKSATDTVYTLDVNANLIDTQIDTSRLYPDQPGIGFLDGVPLYVNNIGQPLSGTFSIIATYLGSPYNNGPDLSVHIPETAGYVHGIAVCVDSSCFLAITGTLTGYADAWYLIGSSGLIDSGTVSGTNFQGLTTAGWGSRCWRDFRACILESDRIHFWTAHGASNGDVDLYEISDAGVMSKSSLALVLGEFSFTYPSIIADDGFVWITSGTYVMVATRHPRYASTVYDLGTLVAAECAKAGLVTTDYDITDLTGTDVAAYSVGRQMTIRAAIQPLQQAYFFDAAEIGGKIVFVSRGGASSATLNADDLGAFEAGGTSPERLSITRTPDNELPRRVTVNYIKPGDFEIGSQYDSRQAAVNSVTEISLDLPLVLTDEQAAQVAEVISFGAWHSRELITFSTINTSLNPTDVVTVIDDDEIYTMRLVSVNSVGTIGPLQCEAVMEDTSIYSAVSVGAPSTEGEQTLTIAGPTRLEAIDSSLLLSYDADDGVYLAACGYYSGWPGCVVMRSQDNANWSQWISISTAATIGRADTVLGSASSNVYDTTNSLTVTLASGSLASVSEAAFLNGANAALVGDEVVLFQNAAQVTGDTWTISTMIRGARGTEWAIDSHAIGDRVVLLDSSSMVRAPLSADVIGLTQYLRAVTIGTSMETGQNSQLTYAGNGYQCYAPAHLAASDNGDGTYTATWIRRARKNGEWRDYVGVSLVEDTELYRVEVWRAGSILSTVDVTSATATVTATIADIIRVAQVSATVGAGNQSEVTI